MTLHLNKLESLYSRMTCAKFGLNWQILSMYFTLFCYYLLLEKGMAIILNIYEFNPHHTRMLCAKFELNWSSGYGEEDF